jgi:outer membrane lipoprotein-sorting protein
MKNKAVVGILAACVALMLGLSGTQAQTTKPATTRLSPELLDRIQHNLGKIKTVEGDFLQEKHLAILDHVLTIKGHFAMQKPDRLIWIVHDPVRYAIRVSGDEVRQWDEDTKHVDVINLAGDPTFKAVSQQIQGWFLGDYQALSQNYDADVLGDKPLVLAFTPKAGSMVAKMLSHIQVTFAAGDQYVEKMAIDEADGDRTTVEFIHVQVNQPIAEDVWRIPPK